MHGGGVSFGHRIQLPVINAEPQFTILFLNYHYWCSQCRLGRLDDVVSQHIFDDVFDLWLMMYRYFFRG